jgi:sugar fermentation stimulation protein A
MQFTSPLVEGILLKRYKRFMADIQLKNGEIITAHCPNSGALLGGTTPGLKVWVTKSDDSKRKLPYTWQFVEIDGQKVGVNTHLPNKLVYEAFENKKIDELLAYDSLKPEVKYGQNSRIDFLMQKVGGTAGYLEIKNVHYKIGKTAYFPDCVTQRGTKHLNELTALAKQGIHCVVLYVIQVQGCETFEVAHSIDPVYSTASKAAQNAGVEFLAYECAIDDQSIRLSKKIKVV